MKLLLLLLAFIPLSLMAETSSITLTEENTISLRDSVNWRSMSQLQYDLLQKSNQLSEDEPIYLVLDTPGGSVSAGEMFIETLKGIKQPVHAIVIFAASMGFQITQATDARLILESGTLMSHRATVSMKGQLDGEVESRLGYVKSSVEAMETRSANRIGMSLANYKARILNEWWEVGPGAVTAKVADRVVTVRCGEGMSQKIKTKRINSLFGSRILKFSVCPLITSPIDVGKRRGYVTNDKTNLDKYINDLYFNKRAFIKSYINTGLITN